MRIIFSPGLLFLIGRGIGSLFGGKLTMAAQSGDWLWLAGFAVFVVISGLLLNRAEKDLPSADDVISGLWQEQGPDLGYIRQRL